MNRLNILVRFVSGLALVAALLWVAAPARASAGWSLVSSPNVGTDNNALGAVAATSPSDVWAVGGEYNTSLGRELTLIEHFNGTSWSIIPSPNVGTVNNSLSGVAAISPSDAWAVGSILAAPWHFQTLVEHWNGMSWTVVPSPNAGTVSSSLVGVTVISASNLWAVGHAGASTLIEHYNGTNWSIVSSPSPGTFDNVLYAVSAISATDVWAAGYLTNCVYGCKIRPSKTLFEHWNGASWSVVGSPSPASRGNFITGVKAVSATAVWGVGYDFSTGSGQQTLIEHWNGSSWSLIPSPNVSSIGNWLYGVTAVSASDVWAVGYANGFPTTTLIEHWNGSNWSVVPSPSPGTNTNSLSGVTAISASSVWAVGDSTSGTGGPQQTLIEHCC